jgi:hypothetical protein
MLFYLVLAFLVYPILSYPIRSHPIPSYRILFRPITFYPIYLHLCRMSYICMYVYIYTRNHIVHQDYIGTY